MPFEHQQQQFKKYNDYTHFTYIWLLYMVSIIYFIILKYITYTFLWFTIDVLVSNIFNCISLVLFEFSKWNKYFFSNTKCSRSGSRIADRTRPQGLELSIMAGLLPPRFPHLPFQSVAFIFVPFLFVAVSVVAFSACGRCDLLPYLLIRVKHTLFGWKVNKSV